MGLSRRKVLQGLAAAGATSWMKEQGLASVVSSGRKGPVGLAGRTLSELGYDQVEVRDKRVLEMQMQTASVLMAMDEDSLLKPFRQMTGRPAPGVSLGGWYEWKADFDFHHDDAGFAPASTFGQWTSALSRLNSAAPANEAANSAMKARVIRLHRSMRESMGPTYFAQTRFPAYTYDKLVCGLVDAQTLAGDDGAWETLGRVTEAARPSLPKKPVERERQWAMGKDESWMWDESYTMPENLYRAASAGAGKEYLAMARGYLEDDSLFGPLSKGENVLSDKHAYSYTNALCSAMQAYFVDGSEIHLRAAVNAFAMIEAQSFVTGGWGPDELFRKPGYAQVAGSLTKTHNSFEVPCGSFAHLKLTRYLLRATRDGRYGDSMERVIHNALLGVLPLQSDGHSFYYADYNLMATKVYSVHRWPCCSGTLPQVLADLGINGYLREPGAIWVNLYQASVVRWTEDSSRIELEQSGDYLKDGLVKVHFTKVEQPRLLTLRLRIPKWAGTSAKLRMNGEALPVRVEQGFVAVQREWKTGDVIELELPLELRIESMPAEWPPMRWGPMALDTIALMRGPEVLFAIREPWESGALAVKVEALLKAEQSGPREWTVHTPAGPRLMVPWTEIGRRFYTAYLKAL